ncbi:unnamed protein product [Vicia faba]|uniref:Uncharacterized protein n=1 Tax=Vicia faba TaxID=3906 RepID=A0AAV0YCF3_VICFA|nr:unnamed protein product [Vicia faba]
MRAALMWTINDFPAYDMLSGWGTHGRMGCPYCMECTKAFTLDKGGKSSWFNCHRRFLPSNHPFRKNKTNFKKDEWVTDLPLPRLSPVAIWNQVRELPKFTDTGKAYPESEINQIPWECNISGDVRMKKFFHVLSRDKATSSINLEASETQHPSESIKVVDYELLETDPGIRPPISSYHHDIQNEVIKDVDFAKIGLICMIGLIIVNLRTWHFACHVFCLRMSLNTGEITL